MLNDVLHVEQMFDVKRPNLRPHIISVAYSREFCSNLHRRKRGRCRRRREGACTVVAMAFSRLIRGGPEGQLGGREQGGGCHQPRRNLLANKGTMTLELGDCEGSM